MRLTQKIERARELRRQGWTMERIGRLLGYHSGRIHGWVAHIDISEHRGRVKLFDDATEDMLLARHAAGATFKVLAEEMGVGITAISGATRRARKRIEEKRGQPPRSM